MKLADAFIKRGVDWLAMTEDLPDPANRVTVTREGRIRLDYQGNSLAPHHQLVREAVRLFRRAGYWKVVTHMFKNENTTHQCGTLVFGDEEEYYLPSTRFDVVGIVFEHLRARMARTGTSDVTFSADDY